MQLKITVVLTLKQNLAPIGVFRNFVRDRSKLVNVSQTWSTDQSQMVNFFFLLSFFFLFFFFFLLYFASAQRG